MATERSTAPISQRLVNGLSFFSEGYNERLEITANSWNITNVVNAIVWAFIKSISLYCEKIYSVPMHIMIPKRIIEKSILPDSGFALGDLGGRFIIHSSLDSKPSPSAGKSSVRIFISKIWSG